MVTRMKTLHTLAFLAFLAAAALTGCSDDGGTSLTSPPTADDGCTEGFVGCDCLQGVACWPGSDWVCVDGTCQEPSCTVGTLDCACFPNNSCHAGADGEPLACANGVCTQPVCPEGTIGCPCGDGGFCADELRCGTVGDRLACIPGDCEVGDEGCACGPARACDGGLICARNACIAPNCIPGTEGCWCQTDLSCGDGLACNDDLCEPIGCTPGNLGCACDAGHCTAPGAFCDADDTCQQADCLAGQEGCPCLDGVECATGDVALFCDAGSCRRADCAPGEPGCACLGGATCELGAHCREGNCIPDGCAPGSLSCNCAAGACHPGLRCRTDNLCIDGAGAPAGSCYEDGTCDRGARCDDEVCVRCTLGTPGCACDDGDSCVFGSVCMGERCVAESDRGGRQRPDPAVCYTPCGDGTELGNRRCSADGLLEGCVAPRECREGSCLLPDEEPRECQSDFECPYFQTCIDSLCFAECRGNGDCSDGLSCFNRVCRATCSGEGNPCPAHHHCETTDGNNGFCVPTPPADGDSYEVAGDFSLNVASLQLTNTDSEGSFQIRNNSTRPQTYAIRALRHDVMTVDGQGSSAVRVNDGPVRDCDGPDCSCEVSEDCVDPGHRCTNGACRPRSCAEGTCPLSWLSFAVREEEPQRVEEYLVEVPAGQAVTVTVSGAGETDAARWEGTLEVHHAEFGSQELFLIYNEIPEGHWAGEMVYLGTFGTRGLEEWSAGDRSDTRLLESVGNALVQRWGAVRRGRISWREFEAVLTATATGSWDFPNVHEACEAEACYLYDIGVVGVARFSNDLDSVPVPTGAVELPFGVNLRFPDPVEAPAVMTGAVDSGKALQYAGSPAVTVQFDDDARDCSDQAFGACLVYVDSFEFESVVGGRYPTLPGDGCGGDEFRAFEVPSLIPGFTADSFFDPNTNRRYTYECRDSRAPFVADGPEDRASVTLRNLSLAGANPVPDGQARRRTLRVLDGALVNQSQLFLLFEERYESFFDGDDEGFSAYGYMLLERRGTQTDDTDEDENDVADVYEGADPPRGEDPLAPELAPVCSPDLLAAMLGGDDELTPDNIADAVHILVEGRPIRPDAAPLAQFGRERVHYLCDGNGLIDGGPDAPYEYLGTSALRNDESCTQWSGNGRCEDGGPNSFRLHLCPYGTDRSDCGIRYDHTLNEAVACPEGTGVRYFTINDDVLDQRDIAELPCQDTATCSDQLAAWAQVPGTLVQVDPRWECLRGDYCDDDRTELRAGKRFYEASERPALIALRSLTNSAFRYETQFRGRDGAGIGFTPEACDPTPGVTPYCYDPQEIEAIQDRVDCLLHVHREWYDVLDDPNDDDRRLARDLLDDYLRTSFSLDEEPREGEQPRLHDGFERQLAQLFIMLGDDALAAASFSRYDLGRINGASFQGSRFEQGGVDLSGPVGFEMDALYRSAQYYQAVLDRFYRLSPVLYGALAHGTDPRNFVTPDTVLLYLDRVIASSTQKARVYGEIARRYQQLGEPELARRVSQRAYTSAYLESILMTRMMLRVVDVSFAEDRRQIRGAVEDAQRRYRAALLDMQNVHSELEDGLTAFGFAPDYVPFPALDREDFRQSNAFEILLNRARAKIQTAREREELALNSDREFETNEAQFQSELAQLRNNYEGQLGEVCGTIVVDGRVYPATRKYAYLTEATSLLGDPCGLVGNGQLTGLSAQINELRLEVTGLAVAYANTFDEMEIERQRVSDYCDEILEFAEMVYDERSKILSLQDDIRQAQQAIGQLQATAGSISTGLQSGPAGLAALGAQGGTYVLEEQIQRAERRIAESELAIQQWEFENQCDLAEIDSQARIATMRLRLRELDVEGLKIEARMRTVASEIVRVQNLARRLQIEQEETEALQINVQAAHNDPNVRIFRNDAILNAEISFNDAIRELYKLTRVFEYYTSQSYPDIADLFLIRLVARGDTNLENYLSDIENAFFEFEEFFGNPATRVQIVSLKDDILAIPHLDGDGNAYSESERTRLLRDRLTDPALLDANGYITMSFSTDLRDLSPLTRNHKLLYVEADVYGNDTGDYVARLYLRSKGSAVIHSVDDEIQYYRFDPRTAVLNTIFGGVRYFDPSVYQSYRHRDRPFVNTQWELVINQRDERANQDLNLRSVTDIRLYLYYTDVTVF